MENETLRPKEVAKAEHEEVRAKVDSLAARQKELKAEYDSDVMGFPSEKMAEYKSNQEVLKGMFDRLGELRNEIGSGIMNDVNAAHERYIQGLEEMDETPTEEPKTDEKLDGPKDETK